MKVTLLKWKLGRLKNSLLTGVEMGTCVSKRLCPPTPHNTTYTWSPCESRVCGGRPNFRRYSEQHIPEPRKKDTDAEDGVSINTPGGRQLESTSLLFPRPGLLTGSGIVG